MIEGQVFTQRYAVTPELVSRFMAAFGDRNPLHVDADYARERGFAGPVAHGNVLGGFLSHFVGEALPTRQVILQGQALRFRAPVYAGDELELEATVAHVSAAVGSVELAFKFRNGAGKVVASGTLNVGVWDG